MKQLFDLKATAIVAIWIILLQSAIAQGSLNGTSSVNNIIHAEEGFAKMAFETSVKEAFMAYMNENSIIEAQGNLVNGLPLYQKKPKDTSGGKLLWRPVFATISAAGDLGYTTGPYRFVINGEAIAFGDFATVWQRQPDGAWKFIIDLGCRHPAPKSSDPENTTLLPETKQLTKGSLQEMLNADSLFTQPVKGMLHPALHVLHDGKQLLNGTNAQATVLQEKGKWQFNHEGSNLSASGDLGVVYGHCQSQLSSALTKGIYMHIWRLDTDGHWQLLHETIKYTAN